MSDSEPRSNLRYDNLTDWFIHESRNAFVTAHTKDPDLHWERSDYEEGKAQMSRIVDAFDSFSSDGTLARSEIEKFVLEASSRDWNATTVDGMWKKCKKLIDKAIKDY